jgi:hypothetical protein
MAAARHVTATATTGQIERDQGENPPRADNQTSNSHERLVDTASSDQRRRANSIVMAAPRHAESTRLRSPLRAIKRPEDQEHETTVSTMAPPTPPSADAARQARQEKRLVLPDESRPRQAPRFPPCLHRSRRVIMVELRYAGWRRQWKRSFLAGVLPVPRTGPQNRAPNLRASSKRFQPFSADGGWGTGGGRFQFSL